MKTPEWLQPGLVGAAVGAVALAIVGFSWGGWMTASSAQQMASSQARSEVVNALVPICVEQSQHDPGLSATVAQLHDASSFRRGDIVMNAGWATMPGTTTANRQVASACAELLMKPS